MILREGLPVKVVTYHYIGQAPEHRNVRIVVYGTFRKKEIREIGLKEDIPDFSNMSITQHVEALEKMTRERKTRKIEVVMLNEVVHVSTGGVETDLTKNKEQFYKVLTRRWLRNVEMKRIPDNVYLGYKI